MLTEPRPTPGQRTRRPDDQRIEDVLLPPAAARLSDGGPEAAPRRGFWRRRVLDALVGLLAQGLTPERLAVSLVLGLFPVVGVTTLLCLAAGFAFRLNHVALQLA
jgi:hypothetical protein